MHTTGSQLPRSLLQLENRARASETTGVYLTRLISRVTDRKEADELSENLAEPDGGDLHHEEADEVKDRC
jgi:hypothetical protein